MTRTFQNGRERPKTCISDSLLRLRCMKSLRSVRERSQRLLLAFRTVTLAQRDAWGHLERSRPFCCLFPSSCVEMRIFYLQPFSGHTSKHRIRWSVSQALPPAFLLLVSVYTIIFLVIFYFSRSVLVMIWRPLSRVEMTI